RFLSSLQESRFELIRHGQINCTGQPRGGAWATPPRETTPGLSSIPRGSITARRLAPPIMPAPSSRRRLCLARVRVVSPTAPSLDLLIRAFLPSDKRLFPFLAIRAFGACGPTFLVI